MNDTEGKQGFIAEAIDDIRHELVEKAWSGEQQTGNIQPTTETESIDPASTYGTFPQGEEPELDSIISEIDEQLEQSPALQPYGDEWKENTANSWNSMSPENNQPDTQGYSFSLSEMEENLPSETDLENNQEIENDLER